MVLMVLLAMLLSCDFLLQWSEQVWEVLLFLRRVLKGVVLDVG
jgi:hypothetical protein